ncbi:transglutaminase family protein [Brachybacterium sp. AOP42-C2-15]|uniref:transglutaminase family protein n=1 Tax=Brachybacterium sp. AOP42-C2-15 TaxID=3457670 RepID=UPI0040339D4F
MSPLMGRPTLEGLHLIGRALLLLAALLLASAPTSQLLAGSSWLLLTLTASAPVILGGIVLRRLLRPLMLVPLAQLGLIVVLVLVVEIAQGLTRWQHGPLQVLRDQGEIFSRGVNELVTGMAPLTLGAPGTVLVVAVIALVTLLLDLMYLDLGWHTPTGLLLMGAILVPALQQPSGGPWWHVTAPVLAGVAILATRTVHADPSYIRGDRRPQAGPAAHPGRTLAVTVLCVALVAGLSPLLAPALPQLAPARIALNMDLLQRWQDPDAPALGAVMIDDDVSVRRSLLQQEDTEVLRYTTTAEDPSYLRLRALNRFDGETFRGDVEGEGLVLGRAAFSDSRDDGVAVHGSADDFIDTTIDITSFAGDRLPVPDNVREIQASDRDLNRAMILQPSHGEVALNHVSAGLIGERYSVASEQRSSTAEQLRAVDPAVFEQPFEVGYTSQDEVPEVATELATTVAASAGAENGFDTAVAYQDYFRNSFAYSLTVNSAPGEDPLESFLTDRIGYCEQFAAAFALMMTSQGYPARVVIGFTAGEQDGDEWRVSAKNAHAWPEVWFGPEHGWVRFEPTPAAAANGVNPPGVTDASTPQDAPDSAPEDPEESDQPTEETPSSEEGTTDEQTTEDTSAAETSDGGGAGPSEETVERLGGGVMGILGIGTLLAAAAAAAVILIRRRRMQARDERWAALLGRGSGAGRGGPGGGGTGGDGAGGDGAGGDGAGGVANASALAAERMHRRAGELAWSELTRELAVRETAIRWLSITGAWGRPPLRIRLDPALPPARALTDLLDQIGAGTLDVTAEQRAAAARIAAAYTDATYAAPLPDEPTPAPASAPAPGPASAPAPGSESSSTPSPAPASAQSERPRHPLRNDSDQVIELIRNAR